MKHKKIFTLSERSIFQLIEISRDAEQSESCTIERAIEHYYNYKIPFSNHNKETMEIQKQKYKETERIIKELSEKWKINK